jgi:hypothetical protein
MLDAYIIEAIRREEQRRREEAEAGRRIWLEIPMMPPPRSRDEQERGEEHGPIVIPLYPDEDAEREEDAA